MSVFPRFAAALLLAISLPLAAAPMHEQYLPPDDLNLRDGQPQDQQLLQITDYSVVIGTQRQSTQQPIPITTPLLVRLEGKPMNKGGSATQVLMHFDPDSKSLKKPGYDADSKTLSLYYPPSQYRAVMDLLRNGTVYCQYLVYPNGHVWADLHTGQMHVR